MSAKTNAEVVIDGKVYTLSGYENEEYLQKVAAYINNKIAEFDDMDEYKHLPGNMKSTLIELNIADDYFKAKKPYAYIKSMATHRLNKMFVWEHTLQTFEAVSKPIQNFLNNNLIMVNLTNGTVFT